MISGKDFLKSHDLSWRRKMYSDWEDVTSSGTAFQVFGWTSNREITTAEGWSLGHWHQKTIGTERSDRLPGRLRTGARAVQSTAVDFHEELWNWMSAALLYACSDVKNFNTLVAVNSSTWSLMDVLYLRHRSLAVDLFVWSISALRCMESDSLSLLFRLYACICYIYIFTSCVFSLPAFPENWKEWGLLWQTAITSWS